VTFGGKSGKQKAEIRKGGLTTDFRIPRMKMGRLGTNRRRNRKGEQRTIRLQDFPDEDRFKRRTAEYAWLEKLGHGVLHVGEAIHEKTKQDRKIGRSESFSFSGL
jgi:hypothetical protein